MSSQTPNINLTLPVGTEKVSRTIINDNNTKIDTAVGNLSNQIASLSGGSENFVNLWCVGTYVLGWGIVIEVVSNKTITITSAEVLDDTASFVSTSVSTIEPTSQHLQRNITLDTTGLTVTSGKAYLCKLTGSES